jgi:hypothetical protein
LSVEVPFSNARVGAANEQRITFLRPDQRHSEAGRGEELTALVPYSAARKFSVKKPKYTDIDKERATEFAKQYSPDLLKAVLSRPPLQTKQKIRNRKERDNQKQNSVTDQIYNELQQPGFRYDEARSSASSLILEPILKLAWTRELDGYADARRSAENAMQRIYAGTEAARAGLKDDPWLDVCLYKVRAGLLQGDSPEVLRRIQHAQRIGNGQWFIGRLAAAFKNAAKRVPGTPKFSELRAALASYWLHNGFWLMSNSLIARLGHVSREAIRKAVRELKLMKHRSTTRGAPIVKGVDSEGRFIFAKGYPPKG